MNDDSDDEAILKRVVGYGHLSVLEFDNWIFGVEGVSRTLTHQLVRKRIASYAQESMRYTSQDGEYQIIVPKSLEGKTATIRIPFNCLPGNLQESPEFKKGMDIQVSLEELADISHQWYEGMQAKSVPNEDSRFGLLEASKTKIMIQMNSHALLDFFAERTCSCAQWEIRGMAREMLRICKELDPVVFENAGPKCIKLGYCPEAKAKHCGLRPHKTDI
jgi:thymidylate synthase (FAD)